MKYLIVAALILVFAATVYAACDQFSYSKTACEDNQCYWCERCSNNEGNTFGQDKCVATNGDCLYGPSILCGSQCATNNDCKLNLTDTTCMYNAICSAGSCNYQIQSCQQNGTISGNICFYGKRECSTNGCSVSSCTLSQNQVCDPAEGCVPCGQDDCGTNGDYYQNYECRDDRVFAERVIYSCNATACLFSKNDALIQECTSGCDNAKCNEPLCNFKGIIKDCNIYDGFFEQNFCVGSDVYRIYRDYYCGVDNCEFNTENRFIQSCSVACSDGQCTNTLPTGGTPTTPPVEVTIPPETQHGQVARSYSDNVFNGWFFGKRDLEVETTPGRNGVIKFQILETNRVASLKITTGGREIFYDRPQKGAYSINFDNAGDRIIFSADSSGWVFFMPNSYFVSKAYVVYDTP